MSSALRPFDYVQSNIYGFICSKKGLTLISRSVFKVYHESGHKTEKIKSTNTIYMGPNARDLKTYCLNNFDIYKKYLTPLK